MKLCGAFGFFLLLLSAMAMSSGCSTPPRATHTIADRHQDPPGIRQVEEKTVLPEYRLGFGDVVEVKFFDNARFNETVAVRPDGRITIEKIGAIFVAGMTPSQLDSIITNTYARIIRSPEVTVFVRQFGGYQVYVLGEVNAPGGYPLQRDMTLLQAIAAAGGPKETAQLKSVVIVRRGERDEMSAFRADLTKPVTRASSDLDNEINLQVQAQDVVFVPKTFIANLSTFMKQVYDLVLPPFDIYLRAALWWNR